jgi:prepilin-type N-terminal cleavage/methylation domain-containing protein
MQSPMAARPDNRGERAFTLIELLVVMIIIAILMAIAVPTFLSQKANASKSRALQNIHHVKSALEACAMNYSGDYGVCSGHALLVQYEPSLKENLDVWSGQPRTPFEMDVDAIEAGKVVKAPNASKTYQSYIISTWIQDGGAKVWFSEAHMDDGSIIRGCGPGMTDAAAPSGAPPTPGVAVPGSRTCSSGHWN